jgi:hypothetical protein
MDELCRSLEARRRVPNPQPGRKDDAALTSALTEPKPTFLDKRQIVQLARPGGQSVLMPRADVPREKAAKR